MKENCYSSFSSSLILKASRDFGSLRTPLVKSWNEVRAIPSFPLIVFFVGHRCMGVGPKFGPKMQTAASAVTLTLYQFKYCGNRKKGIAQKCWLWS